MLFVSFFDISYQKFEIWANTFFSLSLSSKPPSVENCQISTKGGLETREKNTFDQISNFGYKIVMNDANNIWIPF